MDKDDRIEIGEPLARELIAAQFPEWADLPIHAVPWNGWDNTTFRLGERMKVRFPTAACYVAQVEKEYRWLPRLKPHLPLPIPVPLALGAPTASYPRPWAVYGWLEGEVTRLDLIADPCEYARDLAGFLIALQSIDAAGGPAAGLQNFHRGGRLAVYDAETRQALTALAREIDTERATAVWEAALAAEWRGRGVWVHGDIAVGNLLLRGGRLGAVIDFGSSGVGDPACDLVITWVFLGGSSRDAFRGAMRVDAGTWARARGWALWKALITLAGGHRTHPAEATPRQIIESVLAEHARDV